MNKLVTSVGFAISLSVACTGTSHPLVAEPGTGWRHARESPGPRRQRARFRVPARAALPLRMVPVLRHRMLATQHWDGSGMRSKRRRPLLPAVQVERGLQRPDVPQLHGACGV